VAHDIKNGRKEVDWIDNWHFGVDESSVGRSRSANSTSALRAVHTAPIETIAVATRDLLSVRRELQQSANAIGHAMSLIDALLVVRKSA